MNIAAINNRALAGKQQEPDWEREAREELLTQEHDAWLRHPQTIDLIVFLSSRINELQNNATNNANGIKGGKILKRDLLKAKATKEIKEYVEGKRKPNEQ